MGRLRSRDPDESGNQRLQHANESPQPHSALVLEFRRDRKSELSAVKPNQSLCISHRITHMPLCWYRSATTSSVRGSPRLILSNVTCSDSQCRTGPNSVSGITIIYSPSPAFSRASPLAEQQASRVEASAAATLTLSLPPGLCRSINPRKEPSYIIAPSPSAITRGHSSSMSRILWLVRRSDAPAPDSSDAGMFSTDVAHPGRGRL